MLPAADAGAAGPAPRLLGWLGLLALGVAAGHLLLLSLMPVPAGALARTPERIEVAFVRELQPATPPVAAPRPAPSAAPAPRLRQLAALAPMPEPAASAPQAEPLQALEPEQLALNPEQQPLAEEPAAPAEPLLPELPALAELDPANAAFDWPPSTRLSYRLTGDVRGPVEGFARVEWLRSGTRYQVHMDVGVGPSIAPLMHRRISSEGEISPEGLRPLRFDEATRVLLREPRQFQVLMDDAEVRLANGRVLPRPLGLQDTASQFVQLTWLFTMQPELLQPGRSIALPLALPRRVMHWLYEVGELEWLDTPAGALQAVHVRARADVAGEAARLGDLVPEAWFAPSLQYLPVRILIRQPGGHHVDLLLERLPQQAEPGR